MGGIINGGDAERAEVRERFRFHPGTAITGPKHDEVRARFGVLALWLLDDVPRSRERSLALTHLQESMMFANAAIAIHTEPEPLRPGQRDDA